MIRSMNIEKNMAETIYSMRLKVREGMSTEQVLVQVSKEKRGVISEIFLKIIEKVNSCEKFETVVDEFLRHEKVENMQKLLSAVKEGYFSEDRFDEILKNFMEYFMKHKKVEINQYTENVQTILNIIVLLMLVPVFVQAFGMFSSLGSQFFGSMDHIMSLANTGMVANAVIIALMMIFMKIKEPVI